MPHGSVALILLLSITPVVSSLSAQTPDQRLALQALRDSLQHEHDAVRLKARLQAAKQDRSKGSLPLLRTATIGTRLGLVTKQREPTDAAMRDLERVLRSDARNAEAWFELAQAKLALQAGGFVAKEGPYQKSGSSYLDGATEALMRAISADSAFLPASMLLTNLVLVVRTPGEQSAALGTLRQASRGPLGEQPDVHLSRGVLERDLGNNDTALVEFDRYLAAGGDASLASLERARTLFFLHRQAEADTAYYRGARLLSPVARTQYLTDLAWIADEQEMQGLDTVSADQAEAWLRQFWEGRDDAAARGRGERLAEHYRRIAYAFEYFRQVPGTISRHRGSIGCQSKRDDAPNGRKGESEDPMIAVIGQFAEGTLLPTFRRQGLLDDRGVIYIRQGPPQMRALMPSWNCPNESWKYTTPAGTIILHFVGEAAPNRLVASLPFDAEVYESRSGLDARYDRLAFMATTRNPRQEVLQREITENRRSIVVGTSTDSYILKFDHPFTPIVQAFGVANGLEGASQVLVVFAVPGAALRRGLAGDNAAPSYPLTMRVVAENNATGRSVRLDTVRVFTAQTALSRGEFLTGQFHLPAPAGTYTVRVMIGDTTGSIGGAVAYTGITVPALATGELAMSDIVLGQEGSGQQWRAGSDTVLLNPLNAYAPGAVAQVYYQLGGLRPGSAMRTSISIRPESSGKDRRQTLLTFEGTATAARMAVSRGVGLVNLSPGEYLLTVQVSDSDGSRVVERDQRINIVR